MKGGDGPYSYTKNSYYQAVATSAVKKMIDEAIAKNLDIKHSSYTPNTFRIADHGCSVGPNTFIAVHNIITAVELKYQSEGLNSSIPEFQVFFNDHTANDFNTLFTSLPLERRYFATGVPGSFHGRLFPEASLNFVHSSYALQWLSTVPKEVVDKNSPAWNPGKIHYSIATNEVAKAYSAQFAKDMATFLNARSQELVCGGMLALMMPGLPNGSPHSQSSVAKLFDLLGSSLMDMAKMGLFTEAKVDSFNLPLYTASPQEMVGLVERNGCFCIEKIELVDISVKQANAPNAQSCIMHLRAGMGGIIGEHFGNEIIDELFDRYSKKLEESSFLLDSYQKGKQLFVFLKRK
ncbi:hypothetical protein HHK36_006714 [Tetracentron sinense]|uniref:Uncharacterized protein n=1 Tax=Tetracentron sinense TaxID=13715 RepID=A0A834ZL24_TETSI|nr:hypothetical protein HHK36_006714 [Tetracentron sinense]